MPAWPENLATLTLDGYQRTSGNDVERSDFDSGDIAQHKLFTRVMRGREARVTVKQSNYDAFDAWMAMNAHAPFDFTDWESGTSRQVRIRGGYAGLTLIYVEGQRLDGERIYSGRCVFEGYV